mgnify:CR=1 FL=1
MAVPSDLPRAFLGLPDESAGNFIRLQRRVRLLAVRALLAHPLDSFPKELSAALQDLRQQLTALLRTQAGPILEAVGNPDVLPHLLLLQTSQSGDNAAQCIRAAVPALLAATAGHPGVRLRWRAPVSRVFDCRHSRVLDLEPLLDGLIASPEGLLGIRGREEFQLGTDTPGCQVHRPFHPIFPGHPRLHLSLIDTNPLSTVELHPDKDGNPLSLGGRSVEDWVSGLREDR